MLTAAIVLTDLRPISDRTGSESFRADQLRGEDPSGKGGFSSVLGSMTHSRAQSSSRPVFAPRRDRPAREPAYESDRSDSPPHQAPLESAPGSRRAGVLRSPDPQESTAPTPMPDHPGREIEQARAQGMNQTDQNVNITHDEMAERDPTTEGEPASEQDETTKNQMSDVTIALSICLREPVVANEKCGPTPSEPQTLTDPVETQPVPPAAGAVMEAAAQEAAGPAPARMDSKALQVPAAVEQGKDGNAASGGGRPGLMVAGLVPTGDRAIPTTMSEVQVPAVDPTLVSLPASHGETGIQNQPARISAGSSLPIEMQASQTLRGGTEGSQQGDRAVAGVMGENRASVQWAQPGSAQDQATGERGNRPAAAQAGSPGASHVQLHGESGFGETAAAMAAERSPTTDGGASRTTASSVAGRTAAPSWSTGDESVPMMQTVSLNLEPADLGPINVRIFMMDRTVHAHIRTDHMDLGQGMLSQQQQLETRLQGSGLEMGEFKVTVDQQQLSRGDSQGWLRHQGEGRPVPADSPRRVPAGSSQEAPAPERQRRTGIVSLFA